MKDNSKVLINEDLGFINTREGVKILVDNSNLTYLSKFKWYIYKDGEPVANIKINGTTFKVKMKTVLTNSFKKKRAIHYINDNPLDNRTENLTFCKNEITIYENYATIKSIDKKRVAKVDLFMVGLIKEYTWSIKKTGYLYRREDRKSLYYHNLVMGIELDSNIYVDHIDSNPLNNLITNFRVCTMAENNRNRIKPLIQNPTSNYKGVSWSKRNGHWRVRVSVDYTQIACGEYINELAAASAYNYYARIYHGEFAKINDIEEMPKEEFELYSYKKKRRNHTTLTGISYHIHSKRWYARYKHDGIEHYVGTYSTEREAAIAYNEDIIKKGIDKKLNIV